MTEFIPAEKGVPIRQPSTANFMISSADRASWNPLSNGSPFNFQIQRNASLLNGFFTRISTSEVVLDWCEPNIAPATSGFTSTDNFSVDISGGTFNGQTGAVVIPTGFYTVENVLDAIVAGLNTDLSGGLFDVTTVNGQVFLSITESGATFSVQGGSNLPWMLGLIAYGVGQNSPYSANQLVRSPDLRRYTFLDFISNDLTYNQELKDASSKRIIKDVVCRWYMSYDNPVAEDGLGFPILMGYKPFSVRRLFSPAKQIRWSPNQPIGNLAFEVWANAARSQNDYYQLYTTNTATEWLMTLQVSEV